MEDLDVLSGRMKDLEHLRIGQKRKQRGQIDTLGERIDRGLSLRPGELHQTQLGEVGAVPHELGIDGDVGFAGELRTQGGDFRGRGQQVHPAAGAPFKKGALA